MVRALTAAEALAIAEADLAYLRALRDAVAAGTRLTAPAPRRSRCRCPGRRLTGSAQAHEGNVEAQLAELLP